MPLAPTIFLGRSMTEQKQPKRNAIPQDDVHPTIVQPRPETVKYLKGWKRPRTAYILFETKEWHLLNEGEKVLGTGLMTLNAESRPEIAHQVEIYLAKGFRILDYGNFPKFNDQNPARAAKATHYSQGAGVNPWDALEKFVKQKISSDLGWEHQRSQLESELNVLKQKLDQELQKKAVRESVVKDSSAQVKAS